MKRCATATNAHALGTFLKVADDKLRNRFMAPFKGKAMWIL
jgi:hypothetical protein